MSDQTKTIVGSVEIWEGFSELSDKWEKEFGIEVHCVECGFVVELRPDSDGTGFKGECEICHIPYTSNGSISVSVGEKRKKR